MCLLGNGSFPAHVQCICICFNILYTGEERIQKQHCPRHLCRKQLWPTQIKSQLVNLAWVRSLNLTASARAGSHSLHRVSAFKMQ